MSVSYDRQEGLVPYALREVTSYIIGCGTTGSWTAFSLCSMGFEDVRVFDYDKVESHNGPAQFHPWNSEGVLKVTALQAAMGTLGRPIPTVENRSLGINDTFREGSFVFSCVDNIDGRRLIAQVAQKSKARRLIDMRMGPESGTVLLVGDEGPMSWSKYFDSLKVTFRPEPACGPRALLPTAHALVGMTLGYWLHGERKETPEWPAPRVRIDVGMGLMFHEK